MSVLKSRRAFLETSGFTAAAMLGSSWLSSAKAFQDDPSPDLIVINARITTMDPRMPAAQAFAVRAGRFTAIGNTTEIKSLAGPKTRTHDAKGMFITPGFNDTHNHGRGEGLLFGIQAGNPFVVEYVTIQSIIDKLKAKAATVPPGTWIVAGYYDDTKVKDNRPLTIADLDKASTTHPIKVNLRGGHAAYYNSKAFALAGITKNTPDPFGGTYEKDARGELSGRATDHAPAILDKAGLRENITPAERARRALAGFEYISKKYAEYGVTSVCYDAGADYTVAAPPLSIDVIQTARQRGNLHTRINFEPREEAMNQMIAAGIKTGFGDEWIRFGGAYEHGTDGGLSSRTMSMTRPYIGVTPPYKGNVTDTQPALDAWAERVHRAGIRLNTHCNGEPAIELTLNAFERAIKLFPRPDARPKFVHCSLPSARQIQRIKALDGQPSEFSTYTYYNSDKYKYFGADLADHMHPYKDMLAAGIKASTGSDFSPGPFDPRMAIQGMVTRKGFNGETWGAAQKVTIDQAILCGTYNGAYSTWEENIKGSISTGKLADYVIFAEDMHSMDPDKIKDVKIVQTVVGGVVRYQA